MRLRLRSVIIAALAGVLALSPLLLWNFEATVRNGLLFFVQNIGFRPDSLSVAAGIFAYNGYQTGVKAALAAQLAAGLLAAWFLRRQDNPLGQLFDGLCTVSIRLVFGRPPVFRQLLLFCGSTHLVCGSHQLTLHRFAATVTADFAPPCTASRCCSPWHYLLSAVSVSLHF